ncbi:DUF955 domain-containing protein [Arthrobacter sp. MYb23]|uniref:ImmA/IrrE family metallo-endopeptidase n=1 Tax=unclassified Arthrobacter TaxID=235627 RepID=UPI000CFD754C|nr:DUF955 domain-containing protein [Arthrobacter sp. MYb51]PRB98084.1 DUF955 domain-containing protein [Arthrobacter sp. MYb23]
MLHVLESRRPGSVEVLAHDAFAEIDSWDEVQIRRVSEAARVPDEAILGCSLAGGYLWKSAPPTLVVAESVSVRRQHFTLLHELGHHLQQTDPDLGEAVFSAEDTEAFEDAACDAFAARVLIPEDLVTESIDSEGLTVRSALALHRQTKASRAAICVRLAAELSAPGVFMVLAPDGTVNFAASRGGIFPPARGSDQSRNPLITAALEAPGSDQVIARDNTTIWYSTGHSSNRLYGQAAWCDGLLLALAVEHGAAWKKFSPPQANTSHRATDAWDRCEECNLGFRAKVICQKCGEARCPNGHCQCRFAKDRLCQECFLLKARSQFESENSVCRDCAE